VTHYHIGDTDVFVTWYGWRHSLQRHAWGWSCEGWFTVWAGPLRVCVARGLV
jgi:hypothetical protein